MPLVHDPLASPRGTLHELGITLRSLDDFNDLDALILAVDHRAYRAMELEELLGRIRAGGVLIDIKPQIDPAKVRTDIIYCSL